MSGQLLRKSLANALQHEFIRLCAEAISFEQELDIVGIVSVTVDSEPNEIVVKVNRKLQRNDRDALGLNGSFTATVSPNASGQNSTNQTDEVRSTATSSLHRSNASTSNANTLLISPPPTNGASSEKTKVESVSPLSIATVNSAMQRSLALPFDRNSLSQLTQMQLALLSATAGPGVLLPATDAPVQSLEQPTSTGDPTLATVSNIVGRSNANEKPVGAQKRKRQAARLTTLRNKILATEADTKASAGASEETQLTDSRKTKETFPGTGWSAEALDLTTNAHPAANTNEHDHEQEQHERDAERSPPRWSASDDERIDVENGDDAASGGFVGANASANAASTSANPTNAQDKPSGLLAGSNPDANGWFTCAYCPALFDQASLLASHYDELHKQIACVYCGKNFSTRQNLRRHERLHTGQKPYVCSVCEMYFYRRDALMTHMGRAHAVIDVAIYRHRNERGRIATIRLNDAHSTADQRPTPAVTPTSASASATDCKVGADSGAGSCTGALSMLTNGGGGLNADTDSHSPASTPPCLKCTVCTGADVQTTYSRESFETHLRSAHNITDMRFCDVCSLAFDSPRTLQLHELSDAHRANLLTGRSVPTSSEASTNGGTDGDPAEFLHKRLNRKLRMRIETQTPHANGNGNGNGNGADAD